MSPRSLVWWRRRELFVLRPHPCGVAVTLLQRCLAQMRSTETRYAGLSIIALQPIKKARPFGRTFCIGGGGRNYSGFALSPSGPPSLRSRVVSPLRGSAEPATRLHSKIERPIKNPNPVGLRFCYWWRRRELNPRPPVRCLRLYMLRSVFKFSLLQPDCQGAQQTISVNV